MIFCDRFFAHNGCVSVCLYAWHMRWQLISFIAWIHSFSCSLRRRIFVGSFGLTFACFILNFFFKNFKREIKKSWKEMIKNYEVISYIIWVGFRSEEKFWVVTLPGINCSIMSRVRCCLNISLADPFWHLYNEGFWIELNNSD